MTTRLRPRVMMSFCDSFCGGSDGRRFHSGRRTFDDWVMMTEARSPPVRPAAERRSMMLRRNLVRDDEDDDDGARRRDMFGPDHHRSRIMLHATDYIRQR